MERNETIREEAKFFFDNKRAVHITLQSGKWLNGTITLIEDTALILQEDKFGEIRVLFERIIDDGIEPREEKE